jgi:LacI family transcriptional regulator
MARVTVQAIADRLGISKFAVSRALSGHSGVSDTTRAAVVEMAERLGYVPRAKPVPSVHIEILYHDLRSMYRELWSHVQAGAQMEGAKRGVATTVRWTDDAGLIGQLAADTDGILLIGPHSDDMLAAIRASALPCVRIGGPLPPLEPMDHVGAADEEGSTILANHLLALGHRRFVYVHGQSGLSGRIRRCDSLRAVAEVTEGMTVEEIGFAADSAANDFRAAMETLFARGYRPTAYVCGNDMVAVMVISELMRMGISVPQQTSVTGFGDYTVASQMSPDITTVRVPYQEMGIAAIRLLLSRIGAHAPANDLPPQRLALIGKLVTRGSTAEVSGRTDVGKG